MGLKWTGGHGAGKTLLGLAVIAILAGPVLIDLSSWLGTALDPAVGEIARFTPAAVADGIGRAVEPAQRQGTAPGCVLDLAAMANGGGSLMVAGLDAVAQRYTVQWSGERTSNGAADCGRSAELVLSRRSLVALLSAAGPTRAGPAASPVLQP